MTKPNPEWKSAPYEAHVSCMPESLGLLVQDTLNGLPNFTISVRSVDDSMNVLCHIKEDINPNELMTPNTATHLKEFVNCTQTMIFAIQEGVTISDAAKGQYSGICAKLNESIDAEPPNPEKRE